MLTYYQPMSSASLLCVYLRSPTKLCYVFLQFFIATFFCFFFYSFIYYILTSSLFKTILKYTLKKKTKIEVLKKRIKIVNNKF